MVQRRLHAAAQLRREAVSEQWLASAMMYVLLPCGWLLSLHQRLGEECGVVWSAGNEVAWLLLPHAEQAVSNRACNGIVCLD